MTNVGPQKSFIIVSDQRIIPIPEALEQKICKMSTKIQRYLYCFEKKKSLASHKIWQRKL